MSDWEFPKAPGDQKNNWERFSTLLYFPKRGAISVVLSPVHLEVCSSYQVVNYIIFTDCAIVLISDWCTLTVEEMVAMVIITQILCVSKALP